MSHVIATVVLDGGPAFEYAVACEVFGMHRPEVDVDYELRLCTPPAGARLKGGGLLHGTHTLDALSAADTIVIPHGPVQGEADGEVVQALRTAHQAGTRLVSFCSGAFTLAATGLLDGRRATTHWMYADDFRRRYPRVRLDPQVLFVDEGSLLTSAGTGAAIDLAIHLVRCDYGAEAARGISRRMVVPPNRDGGQAQYITQTDEPLVDSDPLAPLLDWLAENIEQDVTVADMAQCAAMSERTFARRFKETTGTTPFQWVLRQRLLRAQELLETTDLDIEQVARRSGFGTAANLRHHFRQALDTGPGSYRRTFRPSRAQ